MGDVDVMGHLLGSYRPTIRDKKEYWSLVINAIKTLLLLHGEHILHSARKADETFRILKRNHNLFGEYSNSSKISDWWRKNVTFTK